jgi:hypothetical protein
MRQIVQEVVAYIDWGKAGEGLREAELRFGADELRYFCMRLAGWWYGELLSDPPWQLSTSLLIGSDHAWQQAFRMFIQSVPGLTELVKCDPIGLHFAESISQEERLAIQAWVREHHRPLAIADIW